MKVNNVFDDSGKSLQELIEQFLLIFYNDTLENS